MGSSTCIKKYVLALLQHTKDSTTTDISVNHSYFWSLHAYISMFISKTKQNKTKIKTFLFQQKQSKAKQSKANKTKQNKTKQNKTNKQTKNKQEQNKTKTNKHGNSCLTDG